VPNGVDATMHDNDEDDEDESQSELRGRATRAMMTYSGSAARIAGIPMDHQL